MAEELKEDFIGSAKALIAAKAMLEVRDNAGRTPFHAACAAGNFEMVKLLVEAGSDPNTLDNQGFTALHTVADKGHVDLIPYLLQVSNLDFLIEIQEDYDKPSARD